METKDFNKLPKWAQEEIARLQRKLADANKRIEELSIATGALGSKELMTPSLRGKTVVDPYGTGLIFPQDTSVDFGLGDSYINIRVKGGRLIVNGSETIRIQPIASNALNLWVEQ